MQKFILIKARDGRIGPGSYVETVTFNEYDKAVEYMIEDINDEGGGAFNSDFGNGYSDNNFVYQIFDV